MCGLFGFFGSHTPNIALLTLCATLAAKRGPDGWGVVTEFTEKRDLGRLTAQALRDIPPSRVVIGHCRLATVPDSRRVSACQPIRVGKYVIAHNGTIANADEFPLSTGNDSEAIGHALVAANGNLNDALKIVDTGGNYALSVLNLETMQVCLRAKNSIPLWRHVSNEGTYWCSIAPANDWERIHA